MEEILRIANLNGSLGVSCSDEYIKAMGRLYGDYRQTPEYRLRSVMEWLIKFIQTDLSSLSAGDWSNLKWDIACFTDLGDNLINIVQSARHITPFNKWSAVASPDEMPSNSTDDEFFLFDSIPSKTAVVRLQEIVLTHVKKLLDNNETTFSMPELKVRVSKIAYQIESSEPLNNPDKVFDYDKVEKINNRRSRYIKYHEGSGQKTIHAPTPITVFEYHLASMLSKFALSIIECPGCEIIFLADRINQKFCSHKCQSRQAMRKIQGVSPERYGKRGRPKKENNGGPDHGKKKQ